MRDFNTMFHSIFIADRNEISDDVSDIQRAINAEFNARTIGSGSCTDRIINQNDLQQLGATAARQL